LEECGVVFERPVRPPNRLLGREACERRIDRGADVLGVRVH